MEPCRFVVSLSFRFSALLVISLLLPVAIAMPASAYLLGGPNGAVMTSDAFYHFDGAAWTGYRTAVQSGGNFGLAGLHRPEAISTTSLGVITADTLSPLDGFVAPWWADGDATAPQIAAVVDFFLDGGDLVVLQDDATHDPIGAALGLPISLSSDGTVSNGGAPLFNGPFGLAANVVQSGNKGQLSAAQVTATNGTVVSTNASGQITAAHWPRGAYAPGAGAMLIVTDVDMWTTQATFAPTNANGRFALNGTTLLRVAPAYVLGGPAGPLTPSSTSWSWDGGSAISDYRAAIEHPANFGSWQIASLALETVDLATVDAGSLVGVDAFVSSYWADAETTPAQTGAVVDFFLAGGDLILLQDDSSHDAIGQQLGIPTSSFSTGSASNGGAPLFEGPFGHAENVVQVGTTGALSAADVALHHGTVAATNATGQITAAVWNRGDYAPGAGRLVVIADVNMVSDGNYTSFDDNARFALNATAFAVASQAYLLGGPGVGRTGTNFGYAWEGGDLLAGYREAIEERANFGPEGRVGPRPIASVDLGKVTERSLAQVDGFVSPWWSDANTTAGEAAAVVDFFLAGGDLILLQDDASHDEIGALLGLPIAASSDGGLSNGGTPLFTGPFGSAANLAQTGNTGQLAAVDVAAQGGTVAATNASGQITAALWNAGDYALGAGRLLIVTDVDMWASFLASYDPLNPHGIFALNGTAFVRGPNILAGPRDGIAPSSDLWGWGAGGYMADYRAALETGAYFGPGGIVPVANDTIDLAVINATALVEVDAFVAPYWADADTTPSQRAALIDFFKAGGDLVLLQDEPNFDSIGEALGIPTLASAGTVSNGGAPLFVGPFGNAANVLQSGDTGRLDPVDVAAQHGAIVGTNTAGEVTAAFWNRGAYSPGAGRLLIVADVDMWATTTATYAPLNANGTFALNGTFIATPEPAVAMMLASGCALLVGLGARRRARR